MNIPVIDISAFITGNEAGKSKVASQIKDACISHGFFYVSNHGISESLQTGLEELGKRFFALPEDEKMKIRMERGGKAWRGYFPVGGELTSGKPDQKEGLYFGSELDEHHPKVKSDVPLHGKNQFPEFPSELGKVVLEYMKEVTRLGHVLMEAVAMSLGLNGNYFHNTITADPTILFRIFHYPAQAPNFEAMGVGEHTDYGLLTILKQDDVGGLQIKAKYRWIDAPPIKNTFVCNIGDMLDKMTNGLYKSTPHRVLNKSNKNRLSFPLFFDPSFDAIVHPIKELPIVNQEYIDRWDGENVYNSHGTYGNYLINKVGKVFPTLLE